jgi:hypothetical protein
MPNLDRPNNIAKHLIFNLAIGYRETVMLSLMFGPGIKREALEIGVQGSNKKTPMTEATQAMPIAGLHHINAIASDSHLSLKPSPQGVILRPLEMSVLQRSGTCKIEFLAGCSAQSSS